MVLATEWHTLSKVYRRESGGRVGCITNKQWERVGSKKNVQVCYSHLQKIFSHISWQHLECRLHCPHIQELMWDEKVPPTVKLNVTAKLSMLHDAHLACKANNYQFFPVHLSERWSGYNIIQLLHDLVPVRAVLPQFYGHYVPEKNSNGHSPYLSPILLLENCGIPINPKALNKDDKSECASLFYRFHEAGWDNGWVLLNYFGWCLELNIMSVVHLWCAAF